MEDFLIEWMLQFSGQDDRSVDAWDSMIYNCGCACYRNEDLVPDVDLDDIWSCSLAEEECRKIGWCLAEEMDDDLYNSVAEMYGWPKRISRADASGASDEARSVI